MWRKTRRQHHEAQAGSGQHATGFATLQGTTHTVNQDAGGAWTWHRSDGTPATLLIVADGVSSGDRSEEASTLTVEVVRAQLAPLLAEAAPDLSAVATALSAALSEANRAIVGRPHASLVRADATTVVAIAVLGRDAVGTWCGDSRAYRVTHGSVHRLTRDHSWAEEVVARGLMTEEQASSHPSARMITRWLGPPGEQADRIEHFQLRLDPGDSVLCCSDGLSGYFSPPRFAESEIGSIVQESGPPPQRWVDQLVEMAARRGGHDDITVAALTLAP